MAPAPLLPRTQVGVPIGGEVMSVIVSLISISVVSAFLVQRIVVIKAWRRLPLVVWIVLAIFIDSYCFIFTTAILQQSFGVNSSAGMCSGAILLCLICYVTTKLIYLFLVEKAHIIRSTTKPRLKSKLYIFNSFGMLGIYIIVVILNFIFRIARLENGRCYIGMQSIGLIPLISFDFVVNVYLTILFLIPLKNLYSFKNMPRTSSNIRLRTVAFRTFVGACCTLMSSIINLTVLMALNGEPGWVCLMCCNLDILFSALVVQWVTSKDNAASSTPLGSVSGGDGAAARRGSVAPASIALVPTTTSTSPLATEAGLSLVTTARSSSDRSDKYPKIPSPPGVLVTTTIRRQSSPTTLEYDLNLEKLDGEFAELGCAPRPSHTSYGTSRQGASSEGPSSQGTSSSMPMVLSETRITAGRKKEKSPQP